MRATAHIIPMNQPWVEMSTWSWAYTETHTQARAHACEYTHRRSQHPSTLQSVYQLDNEMCCCVGRVLNYFRWCSGVTPPCAILPPRPESAPPRRTCNECSGRVGGRRSLLHSEETPRPAAPLPWWHSLWREETFKRARGTLSAARVHTTELLSTSPAQKVATQVFVALWKA